MNTLIVRHTGGPDDEPKFHVERLEDGKRTKPAVIRPPVGFPVEGRPNSDLMRELRWYLETFLGYPFEPETDHADRVLDALRKWGRQAFDAVFDTKEGGKFLDNATDDGHYDRLHLQISSDDPRVLAWPWEALEDSGAGLLAQTCQIERRLNEVVDPPSLDERLPRDRVNILLVTARPFQEDVRYRSISRPLVELVDEHKLAAHVTVLRPPTFDQLRRHLHEHPGHYHILHFDGHGGYGASSPGDNTAHALQGSHGVLVFEDKDGKPERVNTEQLSSLLRETAIPAVVLNACQSAMIDAHAEDAFASVAASLIKSGIRSVVAMAYSLYVSGGRQFIPAFYERLFDAGNVAQAVRAGRQQMFAHPNRICARGEFPLNDWLVPVVYQQQPLDFSFAAEAKKTAEPRKSRLPEGAHDEDNPYGFVGRDGPLLALERAMLRPPAGILIHGLGGIGKTTLARGFVQWLEATEGLGHGCFWFTFNDIYNAEFVINRMGEAVFGADFITAPMDRKLDALQAAFKDNRFVIVWDNFEVAKGIEGTSVTPNLSAEDCDLLLALLKKLRGGKSKIIITSRSVESWLGDSNRFLLTIGGLEGDERWDYCEVVLRDLGLTVDRDDKDMVELMKLLGGHTLAMRAVIPKLAELPAGRIAAALRTNLDKLDLPDDEVSAKLAATLRFVEESLPEDQRPLLIPLALHEGFVDADHLEYMAKQVDEQFSRTVIDRFAEALCGAGLLRHRTGPVFEMHPALTGFLRAAVLPAGAKETRDAWARAFVDVMGNLADQLAPRELHEQRFGFHVHGANFHHALAEAERLGMDMPIRALIQSLGAYAQNTCDYAGAARLFTRLAEIEKRGGDPEREAAAYHQLGIIAAEQRDFAGAEHWYRKSLAIEEKQGNEHGAAMTYHQLGIIAAEQRDFAGAEQWYRKGVAVFERLGIEHHAAAAYHQLGMIAEEQRDFAGAEHWYRKSLAIKEKQGNEHGAAMTYHQLGRIAQEQRDFAGAEQWYRKGVAVFERLGIEHHAAAAYHQLGIIAAEQRDFARAEQWYRKGVAVFERLGIEHHAAAAYHQLGIIAAEQRDFAGAEHWYRKSLAIEEKQGNEHGAAMTYHQLGIIAAEQRDFAGAEQWYRKSLAIKEKQGNEHGAASTYHQLGMIAAEQRDFSGAEQWYRKSLAIKEKQGNEHGAAITYHQLGMIAAEQRDFSGAEQWYRKSLAIEEKQGNEHGAANTYGQLGIIAGRQERFEEAGQWLIQSVQTFSRCNDPHGAERNAGNYIVFWRQAPPDVQAKLKAMWQKAGLGDWPAD